MTDYPYQIQEPRFGGVALLSKWPLTNSQVQYFGDLHRPRISADIQIEGQKIHFVFVHTIIPVVHDAIRDKELATVGDEVGALKIPVIVFGDLNITPWCFNFNKLLQDGKLHDSERGFGFQPTWCAWIPPMFPIDHILVSDGISVTKHQVLTYMGSDHLPVLVDVLVSPR